MNERIQKLKDQCWVEKRWTVVQDNGMWIKKHIDLEKFAELIVRECAKVADGGWADPGHQIKQHFGVEE